MQMNGQRSISETFMNENVTKNKKLVKKWLTEMLKTKIEVSENY